MNNNNLYKEEISKRSEMQLLELTLSVLTVAGAWRPLSWTSLIKTITYYVYAILLNGAVFMFVVFQFMHVIFNATSAEEITETIYMALVGLIGNFKIITINFNYQNFVTMLNNLSEKPFKPMEQKETMIRTKFDKMIKLV